MKLTAVSIAGFRSIHSAELSACGRLNVIIGKNNCGKLNVLSAIRSFFETFSASSFLNLHPKFSTQDDFHSRKSDQPISIVCTFEMSKTEFGQIIGFLTRDFPQVSNLVSGYERFSLMRVTAKTFASPSSFSLVSKIELGSANTDNNPGTFEKIFELGNDVAPQVYEVYSRAEKKREEAGLLSFISQQFDADDYARSKVDRPSVSRVPIRVMADRYIEQSRTTIDTAEVMTVIETEFRRSETHADFIQAISSRATQWNSELRDSEKTPISGAIITVGGQQSVVPDYVLDICERLSRIKVLYQSERREPIGPADAQRLLSMRVRKGGDRMFRAFQDSVASLIGVEVDAFEDESTPTVIGRRFINRGREAKLDVDNFLVQANGSGIKEALRLMLNIELDEPDIMLIEEPEVHLHPALETSVLRYLKSKSGTGQVFLTTHSTNFIDSGEFSSIHFIRKNPSTSSVLLTTEQAADVIPQELGLRPSSLFMFEKLIFVEGPSDEDIFREWAGTLGFNLSKAGVGFIRLGGSRNIHHFAAKNTTDFLHKRGVGLWFLLDRDENEIGELDKLRERMGSNCKLRILPAREIENLLVKASTLCRYVEAYRDEVGAPLPLPTVEEMTRTIDECAEKLKDYAFVKRVARRAGDPIYIKPSVDVDVSANDGVDLIKRNIETEIEKLRKRSEELETELSSLQSSFETGWKQNKLAMVPGDELLVAVLARYGLTFRKRRDGRRIAALMTEAEVPKEVRSMLTELTDDSRAN